MSAAAQNASYTFFGSRSGGDWGQSLTVSGAPRLGTTLVVSVSYTRFNLNAQSTTWAVMLATGVSTRRWRGAPLPISLPQGARLLVSADVLAQQIVRAPTISPPGSVFIEPPEFRLPIPNTASLVGVVFYQQMILVDVDPDCPQWVATQGGRGVVGR